MFMDRIALNEGEVHKLADKNYTFVPNTVSPAIDLTSLIHELALVIHSL